MENNYKNMKLRNLRSNRTFVVGNNTYVKLPLIYNCFAGEEYNCYNLTKKRLEYMTPDNEVDLIAVELFVKNFVETYQEKRP